LGAVGSKRGLSFEAAIYSDCYIVEGGSV